MNTMITLINESKIQSVNDSGHLFNLETKECKNFLSFLNKNDNYFTLLFRGHNKNGFWYNLEKNTNPESSFTKYQKLFMLGGGKSNQYIKGKSNSKFLVDIKDNSPKVREYIFKEINKYLNNIKGNNKYITFINENKTFRKYFCNESNKDNFVKELGKQILLRDYYLYFLHTANNSKKGNYTYYVSTTKCWEIAEKFANNGYIVCMFYKTKQLSNYGIGQTIINDDFLKTIKESKLPIFNPALYPEQEEVSIKGALFPHFMLGLYDLCNKNFIINPHMLNHLSDQNFSIEKLQEKLSDGISIDQHSFKEHLDDSNYMKGVSRTYNGLYKNFE